MSNQKLLSRERARAPASPGVIGRQSLVLCLLLAAVTLALDFPARSFPFLSFDDDIYVSNNIHVQEGLAWKNVAWAFTTTEAENWHPLTWFSHALDCQLYGLNPAGHHISSISLHVINVLLLFVLLVRVTRAPWRCFLVAALFALHPINVESVVWIAERKNVLSTLFLLLTLAAYGWYARSPSVKRYLLVVLLFAMGLAAKPMVITLPFLLLLLDIWPLRRVQGWSPEAVSSSPKDRGKPRRPAEALRVHRFAVSQASFLRLVLEKLPLLILSAASAVITIIAQRSNGLRSLQKFPLSMRLENAVYSYAMYIWKALWPTRLAAYYPHPRDTLTAWQLLLALVFLAGVSALAWKQRCRRSYLVAGWLGYLITLVPVAGFVQVGNQGMADRYAYVPLVGIFVMLVWGAADLADSKQISFGWRVGIAVTLLSALSMLTWRQIRYWRSDYDLWAHTVQVTKNNVIAEENVSKALVALGRREEALPGLEQAARLNPGDPMRHIHLGSAYAALERYQDAIGEYQKAVQVISGLNIYSEWRDVATRTITARSYESIATAYGELGNFPLARENYRQALKIDPDEGTAVVERMSARAESAPSGARYLALAVLLQEAGDLPHAHAAYEQALQLDPSLKGSDPSLKSLE